MAISKAFHKFCDFLDRVCGWVCVVCIVAMVLLTGAQILCRLYFTALAWSEELTRYLMVWATFLGASCMYRRSGHISVTFIQDLFPHVGRQVMQVCCHLLCGAFCIAAVIYGLEYMSLQSRQLSAALRIPMSWVYLAIPVGCGIIVCYVADILLQMCSLSCKNEEAA